MTADASTQRESQEKSIKARKNELFVNGEVDPHAEPRKTFRQCLKETPAVPLSKNVKLMLWGSAAPVVLLFLAALLAVNKSSSSHAKVSEELIVPDRSKLKAPSPSKTEIARRSDDPATTPAAEPKPEEPRSDAQAKPENPPDEKPKVNKNKGKGKGKKPKPKDDTAVAKTDDAPKGEDTSGTRDRESGAMPNADSSSRTPKSQTTASNDETRGNSTSSSRPSSSPEKPKKSLFKKKKPPVFTYPKREGEKKDESKPGSDPGASSTSR